MALPERGGCRKTAVSLGSKDISRRVPGVIGQLYGKAGVISKVDPLAQRESMSGFLGSKGYQQLGPWDPKASAG